MVIIMEELKINVQSATVFYINKTLEELNQGHNLQNYTPPVETISDGDNSKIGVNVNMNA